DELNKKSFSNQTGRGWFFTKALFDVSFLLNPKEKVKTEDIKQVNITKNINLANKIVSNRKFVLDKPFLMYFKKKDRKEPYFMLWVEDASLLAPDLQV
ncbi:hypothetical protein KKC59_00805, partial [bacterium]|nr:hypothetical protein [bacterium]